MIQNKIERKIMWGDLDSLGIVFYPKYYDWIDSCSHLFFEKISLDLAELWKERQIVFGLTKTSCDYFSPGRYHQEIIITTHIKKIERKNVTIKHIITNKSNDRIMVRGFEKRTCMNVKEPEALNAMDIPDDIYDIFKKAL